MNKKTCELKLKRTESMRPKMVPCTLPCSVDHFCSFLGPLSIISQTQAELRPCTFQPFSTIDSTLWTPLCLLLALLNSLRTLLPLLWQYCGHQRAEEDHFQRKEYFRPGKFVDSMLLSPMSQGFFLQVLAGSRTLPCTLVRVSSQLAGDSPCFRACQLPLRAGALGK